MKKRILTVLMSDPDGVEIEETVTTRLCDQVRAERELRQRRAGVEDSPVLFGTALAWAALAREGKTELGLDEFTMTAYDVKRVDEDGTPLDQDDEGPDLDPTQAAASIGSA